MLMFSPNRFLRTGALLVIVSLAGGCSAIDRISQIGEQPKLAAIENPTAQPGLCGFLPSGSVHRPPQ
jgi:flagellar L-ring protein FlgH